MHIPDGIDLVNCFAMLRFSLQSNEISLDKLETNFQ